MLKIDKCTTVFDIFVYTYMISVLKDGMPYFASQITSRRHHNDACN